ncbi:hypothetical protein CPC16_009804 [Podila verticillata]|nr:hypothetical protein CPC16_009804 [Podila verticillata]
MAPPVRHAQEIRLDGVVKKVAVKLRNEQLVVMLQDVQDIFPNARRLEHDEISVPFMTDDDDKRLDPLRIEYHEGCVLDVVLGTENTANSNLYASAPISIPSPPPTTTQTTPSSSLGIASPISSPPVSIAPLSIIRTVVPPLSAVEESPEEGPLSDALSRTDSMSSGAPSTPVMFESDPPLPVELSSPRSSAFHEVITTDDPLEGHYRSRSTESSQVRLRSVVHTVHTLPQDDRVHEQVLEQSSSPKPVIYNPQEDFGSSLTLHSRLPPSSSPSGYHPPPLAPSALQLQLQHEQQRKQQLQQQWQYQQRLIQQQPLPHHQTSHDLLNQGLHLHQTPLLQNQNHHQNPNQHHNQSQHQQYLHQQQLHQQQQHQQFLAQQQMQYNQSQQYTQISQRQSQPAYENLQDYIPDLQILDHWERQLPLRHGSTAQVSNPPIPPRPHNSSTTSLASQSSASASISTLPTTVATTQRITTTVMSDSSSRISLPLSPTSPTSQPTHSPIHSFSPTPQNPHVPLQHELTHRGTIPSRQASISSRNESDSGLDSASDSSQFENEKVKDLEMQLKRVQDQNLAFAKKNYALAKSSQMISVKIMNKATLVQNKVQEALTQTNELHENPIPRLFVVLPELIMDGGDSVSGSLGRRPSALTPGTRTSQSADLRKFRLYFLCECGSYTKALPTSGVNHVHFVDHEGYEIVKPTEFFQKYGAFIRSFSHLIRNGVHCGTVSIPPLLSNSQQQQHQQQMRYRSDANSLFQAHVEGQETLKNKILDTRLAEAIQYLDSIDTDIREDCNDDGSPTETRIPFIDGKDIRQLQSYLKLTASDLHSLGNLFRYVSPRGLVKWICEDHHKLTVNRQNDLIFQQEITTLGGQYDLRTGRAKIQLATDKEAGLFYRAMGKTPSLSIYELDIGLRWAFTEGDLQRLVQAVIDSKVAVLTLDGGKQKADSSGGVKLMNFGKKYDPLLKVIFSTRIQSLRIINMPSLITKLSLRQVKTDQSYSIKALHLTNVGALDFTVDKGHLDLGSRQSQPLVVKTLLTSFRSLAEISLPGMNIRDDGVQILTEMSQLFKTLRSINLSDNGITPAGGKQLAMFLAKERTVSYLDLGMNSIGDDVLAIIIGALGPKLSALNLESTGFGDKAAKALEKMVDVYNSPLELEPQIEYLNLATNGWTTSGIQSLGRTIMKLRLEVPPISPSMALAAASASPTASSPRPELGSAECFLLINSMIRTSHISLPTDKPWHETPNILKPYFALTATKDSYELASLKAQESIAANSRLKVLRLSDAGLSEGASRYLIGRLDVAVLTKLDLRRCIRLFKPREMLNILAQIYPSSSDIIQDDYAQMQQYHRRPSQLQGPTPFGIVGTPRNCLRFVHLNSTSVDDHVARILSQDLQSGYSCMERLDIGSNHLTHNGITMIMNALCQNTSLQHLNLGQNFDTPNSVYASAAALAAQNTREVFARFMATNKTLEILYFTTMGVDVVAEGLKVNATLRSLVLDRVVGGLKEIEAFGHALAINKTLMRFKVYDNRIAPFLQAFYGVLENQYHHHGGHHHQLSASSHQIHYVDPFKDIKQDAIRTIDKGMSFNKTLIELQWPELFDKMQPWTERLEAALMRNMVWLKAASQGGVLDSNGNNNKDGASVSTFRGSRGQNGGMLSRGVSVLSTSSTLSNSSTNSSDSLSSMQNGTNIAAGGGGSGGGSVYGNGMNGNRGGGGQLTHALSSSPPQDGYSASVYSQWDERRFAWLELSPWTLNQLRKAPTREQHQQQMAKVQQQQQQQQQRVPRVEAETHVMMRFQKK